MGNVSAILNETNDTDNIVYITNAESPADNIKMEPKSKTRQQFWIPWCDSDKAFPQRNIIVSHSGGVYYIWQSGPKILGSQVGYGQSVDTLSTNIGGQFTLNIASDFSIKLT